VAVDLTKLEPRSSDGSHITKAQIQHIETYMAKVLLALELNYWRVFVAKDQPPEDCRLMIHPTDGRRIAGLFVSGEWWEDANPEEKRTDITHEALHLAHHDQEEVLRRFVRDQGDVGSYPMSIIWAQFKVETERMVDSLSYVLAPHMPPWQDPKTRR
jgi:hypothetical protein